MLYDITSFGAVPDGVTLVTANIQAALDAAHKAGGGTVLVPAGVYLTGTLWLRSRVELRLEEGAMLLASPNIRDFCTAKDYPQNFDVPDEGWCGAHLIVAVNCDRVSITGHGILDGNGSAYMAPKAVGNVFIYPWRKGYSREKERGVLRPGQLVVFAECTHVDVTDVTMQNATAWDLFLHGCEEVTVRGLKVKNPMHRANTDGIDIDCCRYVTVSDCIIETGDDCITFRGSSSRLLNRDRACEFVTVTNCVLACSAAAFRIGVGTAPIRAVSVSDIVVRDCGIAVDFFPEWAGVCHTPLTGIAFRNLTVWEAGRLVELVILHGTPVEDITVDGITGNARSAVRMVNRVPGAVKNIRLRDIRCAALPDIDEYRANDFAEGPDGTFFHCEGIEELTVTDCALNVPQELRDPLISVVDLTNCPNLRVRDFVRPPEPDPSALKKHRSDSEAGRLN